MKRKVLLLFAIIATSNLLFAIERNDSPSEKPKLIITEEKTQTTPQLQEVPGKNIIIFDNLDKDLPVSNYFELAYTHALSIFPTSDPFLNHTIQASFSDQTFAKYKITDFDVAIFPLGEFPLNYTTNGGIKVMDKIKEMFEANKNVMLIGRRMVALGLHATEFKDPVVEDFLKNQLELKVDSSTAYDFQMGNSVLPFRVKGVPLDMYFSAWKLYCNIAYGRNVDPEPPIRPERYVDIMVFNKNHSKAEGFDYIDQIGNVSDTIYTTLPEQLYVGLRADSMYGGSGRLVMWTIAPNVAALSEMPYFDTRIYNAMNWLLVKMPKLYPWLSLESNTITFPKTPLNFAVKKTLKIQNFSKEKLTIYQTVISDFGDADPIFKVTKGLTNVTLEPMEVRSIEIEFYPIEEREFDGALDIHSNATNGDVITVQLQGRGGKDVSPEPYIAVQEDPYDFGATDVGMAPVQEIKILNTGLMDLTIDSLYFDTNTDGSFQFAQIMHTPIVIKGADNYTFNVKFVPTIWGKNYLGSLKIVSNAKNANVVYIKLAGNTPGAPEGPMIEAVIDTTIFDNVLIGNTSRKYIGISNPGSASLKINNIYIDIDKNPDDAFAIDTTFDFPFFIEPNNSINFPVKFTPLTKNSEYIVPLGILSNAVNGGVFYLYMKGWGDTTSSVREIVSNASRTLILRSTPIPITSSSDITVEAQKFFGSSSIDLYDLLGNKLLNIYNGNLSIGINHFKFDATSIPSGQYFISLTAGSERLSLPLMIIK